MNHDSGKLTTTIKHSCDDRNFTEQTMHNRPVSSDLQLAHCRPVASNKQLEFDTKKH